jgi:diaminopimelate epimerase
MHRLSINFIKMVAAGNDFVVVDASHSRNKKIRNPRDLARHICDRKYGIGADGLLVLEKSRRADIRMRIFNPDGSEPEMCGNGIRCVGLWLKSKTISIETKAGIIQARVSQDKVKTRMTEPEDIRLEMPLKIGRQTLKANFINTGVPHAVIFVEGLDKIDVVDIGRQIRFHKRFLPQGVNVDFVQIIDDNNIKIRTYERGVEDETLACGTGAVAAALIYAIRYRLYAAGGINIHTRGGEILRVESSRINGKFKDVWLEGKARVVYRGAYYV